MKKIKLVAIFVVCFVLLGFFMGDVFAQETPFIWQLDGGFYYMISPPYMPGDRDPQESLIDNLGPYKVTHWRFFRYDPELGRYAELKSQDWDPTKHDFDFGRGYWIISRNPMEIDIEGESVGKNWTILEWTENDGWNQIGNIYDYDFPIVSLYVARVSSPFDLKQLIDPVSNDLTYVTLQEFESGSYIDIPAPGKNSLEVGKGYWLKVRQDVRENVVLWFEVRGPSALSKEVYLSEKFFERIAQQEDPPDPPPAIESSSSFSFSSDSGGGGGGCFIATAAYGHYDHPRVQLLREFRDRYLLINGFGRTFVRIYYRYSPILTRLVANRKSTKALLRFNMMPVMGVSAIASKMNIYGLIVIGAFPLVGSFFFLKRRKGAWEKCISKFSGKSREGKGKK